MELATGLRRRLTDGGSLIGSWLSISSTTVAEIVASAGYDFLTVDLEHSPTSLESAAELIRVIDLAGVSPLVRVTSHDPHLIRRVLDAGAHGVIVPNVASAEEAEAVVAATRYAPEGSRGVGLYRAHGYGSGFEEYREAARRGILVVAQIESARAVEDIDSIVTVPGIDAVMIGPYDLSSDLGVPGDMTSPVFTAASARVLDSACTAGVAAGFHLVEPDPLRLRELVSEGYRFLVYSVDMRILDVGARLGAECVAELP